MKTSTSTLCHSLPNWLIFPHNFLTSDLKFVPGLRFFLFVCRWHFVTSTFFNSCIFEFLSMIAGHNSKFHFITFLLFLFSLISSKGMKDCMKWVCSPGVHCSCIYWIFFSRLLVFKHKYSLIVQFSGEIPNYYTRLRGDAGCIQYYFENRGQADL